MPRSLFLGVVFQSNLDCKATTTLSGFSAPPKIYLERMKVVMEAVCPHACSHTRGSSPLRTLGFNASCKLRIWPSMYFSICKQKICVNKSLLCAVSCWRICQLIAIMCILDQRGDGLYLEALHRVLHVMLVTQLWLQALIQSQLQSNSQRACQHSIKKA